MIYQDQLETNLLQLFSHTKFRMVFYNFCYYFQGQQCCWSCKSEENDYYSALLIFTLNSSNQFWTRGTSKPWASAGGNGHLPLLEIGAKNKFFLENLTSAAQFRLIVLFIAIIVYLPLWHSHYTRARFTVLVSGSGEVAVHSCPLFCLQR